MAADAMPAAGEPLTVSEVTRRIRVLLERHVGAVYLVGEVSNVKRPPSGHLYFTLKDENAQIPAVLFRATLARLRVGPANGMQVRVRGDLTVYDRGGCYQVVVRSLEEAGQGALHARFEALKQRLAAEGLFDPARKKPLPLLPQHIGVVTSPRGAAIRDILTVLERRFPNLHVLIAPVPVQGEAAAPAIAAAIDRLNARGGLDVLIVGRGGGSLEDLWCFNEEIVARAIARSAIPVISAVGHEIDFTISDFVADLRAPTPSAAAELVVGRKDTIEERLAACRRTLTRCVRDRFANARARVEAMRAHHVFRRPALVVQQHRQTVDAIEMRMAHALQRAAGRARETHAGLALRLRHAGRYLAQERRRRLDALRATLVACDPRGVLKRGYSITQDAAGRVVTDAATLKTRDRITTVFQRGRAVSVVEENTE